MKLSYEKFWTLLWCFTEAVPVRQARKIADASEEAVRRWYDLFRRRLPEEHLMLSGTIQLDEAYGNGWALVLAKQVGSRKLAHVVLEGRSVQRHHAHAFLAQHIAPARRVNTDGAAIYTQMNQWWSVQHTRDLHKKFEFTHTSEIEGMFGCFRTFVRRMYHHARTENIAKYVREFCARFSSPEIFETPRNYLIKTLMRVPFD